MIALWCITSKNPSCWSWHLLWVRYAHNLLSVMSPRLSHFSVSTGTSLYSSWILRGSIHFLQPTPRFEVVTSPGGRLSASPGQHQVPKVCQPLMHLCSSLPEKVWFPKTQDLLVWGSIISCPSGLWAFSILQGHQPYCCVSESPPFNENSSCFPHLMDQTCNNKPFAVNKMH